MSCLSSGTGQDRTGQDRTGQDRTGQDRTGQDRTGQDRTRDHILWLQMRAKSDRGLNSTPKSRHFTRKSRHHHCCSICGGRQYTNGLSKRKMRSLKCHNSISHRSKKSDTATKSNRVVPSIQWTLCDEMGECARSLLFQNNSERNREFGQRRTGLRWQQRFIQEIWKSWRILKDF